MQWHLRIRYPIYKRPGNERNNDGRRGFGRLPEKNAPSFGPSKESLVPDFSGKRGASLRPERQLSCLLMHGGVLRVHGFVHRGAGMVGLLVVPDPALVL